MEMDELHCHSKGFFDPKRGQAEGTKRRCEITGDFGQFYLPSTLHQTNPVGADIVTGHSFAIHELNSSQG